MNKIIKPESAINLFGIEARAFNVVADDETGRIRNQKIGATRYYRENGTDYRITVTARFDDEFKNGHESFSLTAGIYRKERGRWAEDSFGCQHEIIAREFPELAHLIKWHLTSTDGPMHYLANAAYLAGDRDHNGRAAGEPSSYGYAVSFDEVPMLHPVKESFFKYLQERCTSAGGFITVAIAHNREPGGYAFDPKYTLAGYAEKWHECPFDTLAEAESFAASLNDCAVHFHKYATAYSTGKARELEAARRVAVWPDATDEELSAPREVLVAALMARLPALMAAFEADMRAAGFIYPATDKGE
jgi:hypothetical protein